MALMKCPSCKTEVGNNMAICPNCNYEVWKKKDENYLKKIKEYNTEAVAKIKVHDYASAMNLLNSAIQEYEKFEKYLKATDAKNQLKKSQCHDWLKYIYFNLGDIKSQIESPYYKIDDAFSYFVCSGNIGYSTGFLYAGLIYDKNSTSIKLKDNTNKDSQTAINWYLRAALLDVNPIALNNLGVIYGEAGDQKLGAFYSWCAYKCGREGALANYNAYKTYLVDDAIKHIEAITTVNAKNLEALTNNYTNYCEQLPDAYNHKKEEQEKRAKRLRPVKWIVGIAVLLLCGSLLVRCVGGLLGIGDSDGICDDAGCHSPATCSMGDMEFCLKHYIEWSGRAYD